MKRSRSGLLQHPGILVPFSAGASAGRCLGASSRRCGPTGSRHGGRVRAHHSDSAHCSASRTAARRRCGHNCYCRIATARRKDRCLPAVKAPVMLIQKQGLPEQLFHHKRPQLAQQLQQLPWRGDDPCQFHSGIDNISPAAECVRHGQCMFCNDDMLTLTCNGVSSANERFCSCVSVTKRLEKS